MTLKYFEKIFFILLFLGEEYSQNNTFNNLTLPS